MLSALAVFSSAIVLVASSLISARFDIACGRLFVRMGQIRAWGARVRPRLNLSQPENHEAREKRRRTP